MTSSTPLRHPGPQRRRWALPVAIALPIVVLAVVLGIAATWTHRAENTVPAVQTAPAPAADNPACPRLLGALPEQVGDYHRSAAAESGTTGAGIWQRQSDAVVVRCGVNQPPEFRRDSPLQLVDGVPWFERADPARGASTWFTVDREVTVGVFLPAGSGPTPLQTISDTIAAVLPVRPPHPADLPR